MNDKRTLSTADFDRMAAAVRKVEALAPTAAGARSFPFRDTSERLLCQISYNGNVPAYACLAITGGGKTSDGRDYVTVDQPSTTFRRQYVFNGPRAITYESGVTQYLSVPVKEYVTGYYNSGTPAVDEGWGPTPGQFYLTKNYPEVLTVAAITDSTNKYVFGRIKTITHVIGKLAGSLSQGSTATVNVWGGAGGSEAVISSLTLTGRDWLMKSGATAIASGKKVLVEWINGIAYISEVECA